MWRAGNLPIDLLHADTVPLKQINEALDALAEGRLVRKVITITGGSEAPSKKKVQKLKEASVFFARVVGPRHR